MWEEKIKYESEDKEGYEKFRKGKVGWYMLVNYTEFSVPRGPAWSSTDMS